MLFGWAMSTNYEVQVYVYIKKENQQSWSSNGSHFFFFINNNDIIDSIWSYEMKNDSPSQIQVLEHMMDVSSSIKKIAHSSSKKLTINVYSFS